MSLVAGVAGLSVVPVVGGVLAVLTGHLARAEVRRSNAKGKGLALAGLILGYGALTAPCLAIAAIGGITLFGDNIRSLFGAAAESLAGDQKGDQRAAPGPARVAPERPASTGTTPTPSQVPKARPSADDGH